MTNPVPKRPHALMVAVAAIVAIWLATGAYMVAPNEQGVLLVMGRTADSAIAPGLHWRLPWPLSRVIMVKMRETRRVGVGALLIEEATATEGAVRRNEFVTGDKNLVNLELVVQYDIGDPVKYLFNAFDVDGCITALAESAATRAISDMTVNEVFYENKIRLQERVRSSLRAEIEDYGLGVVIGSVNLQKVRPAPEVTNEFNDVVTARADALRTINEAESYANDILPRSRGRAAAIVEEARAYAYTSVKIATGEAERFRRVLEEYRHAPELTRLRLYTETLEKILAQSRTILVDPSGGGPVVQFTRRKNGNAP